MAMVFEAHICGMATRDMSMTMMDMNFIPPLPLKRVHLLLISIGIYGFMNHNVERMGACHAWRW
jgi:hypothetical protein